VAQYTVEKLNELGAAVTLSDSNGYIYDEAGIDREKLAFVMELKNVRRGRIRSTPRSTRARSTGARSIRRSITTRCGTQGDCAFPCATQNEINGKDARTCSKNGVSTSSPRARTCRPRRTASMRFLDAKILYGPGKAANAGGVPPPASR
jgi:glutamate dehydrogenase (NADP+)